MSNWISVDKKLPDIDNSVIVAFDNGDIDHDWYDKEFKRWSRLRHDTRIITHWQPLPQPPNKQLHTQQETDNWDQSMDN